MGPVVKHTGERPLDELTLLIYPEGRSRFELYEDDGRTNAYRRGAHALTRFECEADARGVAVRIGEPAGDRSVVPAGRRHFLRLRMDAPRSVTAEGLGELSRRSSGEGAGPGWWVDSPGFIVIGLPAGCGSVTVATAG